MRRTTLGAICALSGSIQTGPFGSQLHAREYTDEGVAVIMPQDITSQSALDLSSVKRIPQILAGDLSRHRLCEGDIVYSRRGDVEKSAYVTPDVLPAICGTGCLRVRVGKSPEVSPRFLHYRLGLPDTRSWIAQHAIGATMPNLNTCILSSVPLTIPALAEQQEIVDVLGALDDKIANNSSLEVTLEKHLRALFERDVTPRTAPKIPVKDLLNLNPRRSFSSSDAPLVPMQAVPTPGMTLATPERGEPKGGARFMNGDTLLARITPCLENGKTAYVSCLEGDEVGIGSTEYIVLRSRPGLPLPVSYFIATDPAVRSEAIQRMVGTSGRQRLKAEDFRELEIHFSDNAERVSAFGAIAIEQINTAQSLRRESEALTELRDTLLPALMDGRIRMKDAVRTAEEAL